MKYQNTIWKFNGNSFTESHAEASKDKKIDCETMTSYLKSKYS